jgi:HlyD family secretion protein
MKKWKIIAGVVVAAAVAGGVMWWRSVKPEATQYRTVAVEKGELVQTVRASGTVKPIRLVEVGTQVNGPIQTLYVDFNDQVKTGDLVAQIEPTVYKARLAQEQANVLQSEASVDQAQAKLAQSEKDLLRSRELAKRDMLSQADLDAALAMRDTLAAQLKVALADVEQSKASLQLAQANLNYTVIRSPVDGVVIKRNVSAGQTVVASMSAPVLFQIALDLKQVEIEAGVPEADIGMIRVGQKVTFTVDAYPNEFHGTVAQIRLAATMSQNVVTYPVIIRAENPEVKLFPGMTANVVCEVARREGVLKVPNSVMRFKMATGKGEKVVAGSKVWLLKSADQPPVAVKVKTGITDGSFVELIEAPGLEEGSLLVIRTNGVATGSKDDVKNPFAPQQPESSRRRLPR